MQFRRLRSGYITKIAVFALALVAGCTEEYRPAFLGGTLDLPRGVASGGTLSIRVGLRFTEIPIQQETFVNGKVATTETYRLRDMTRTPVLLDFNGDGRVDPVVGYHAGLIGTVQILLSYDGPNGADFTSLTLDGGENQWDLLADVAVGDIDGDGALDLVVACGDGVVYLHHPDDPANTHVLSQWGQETGALELIAGTTEGLSEEELASLIVTALGPEFDPSFYIPLVTEGYTAVEIADFDHDGDNDIAAARQLDVVLEPKPNYNLEPINIAAGSLQILLNPGYTPNGQYWSGLAVGQHERHSVLDREGASDLHAADLDGDGDLDLITAAGLDDNVQIAWFENPGGTGTIDPALPWTQYRIGSVRGPSAIDVADVTGDGRVDVIAVSPTQKQMVLFVQPEESAARGFDWYTTPIVTFETYLPLDVKAIDIDSDGVRELVVSGTQGAVRFFEAVGLPTETWDGDEIVTLSPAGNIAPLGYGDLDGDGDVDLVVVMAATEEEGGGNRVSWIRNELIP